MIYPSEEIKGKFECYFLLELPEEQQVWLFIHTGDGPKVVIHNYEFSDNCQWRNHKTPFTVQFGRKGIEV